MRHLHHLTTDCLDKESELLNEEIPIHELPMNEMKKILFVMHMPPPVHGAAMVGKNIKESEQINSKFDCHYINLAIASSLEDIGKVGMKKLYHFLLLLCTIIREVKRVKPDLVYITPNAKGGAFYKEWMIVMMLKMMGCRIVAHYHNKGVSSRQDKLLENWMYRRFFKNVKVILLAEALYPDMQKYVRREDVYICPNGIPAERLQESRITGIKENGNIPRLLFLSNLLVDKGVIVLLDALKILKDKGYSFICDFVGGETKDFDSERFAVEVGKRNITEMALYYGKKYGEEKNAFFNSADIFVFPTYYHNECFPLVLLEAMQHGLPIVTTNEGGISEIVKDGENGLICNKEDAQSLASTIEIMISDYELQKRMGECGQKMFEERFTLEVFETHMCNVLKELV